MNEIKVTGFKPATPEEYPEMFLFIRDFDEIADTLTANMIWNDDYFELAVNNHSVWGRFPHGKFECLNTHEAWYLFGREYHVPPLTARDCLAFSLSSSCSDIRDAEIVAFTPSGGVAIVRMENGTYFPFKRAGRHSRDGWVGYENHEISRVFWRKP